MKYSDETHLSDFLYMKMFSWAFVVSQFRSDGLRVNILGSVCLWGRETAVTERILVCLSLAFCLIICKSNFIHSSLIYNVIVSVYTPCIYTFYKYIKIYEPTWSVFVKGGDVHNSFLLLFFYHLDGFKFWPFGRNQPIVACKLSWDWMSITGWRQFRHWTHCPSALVHRTRCMTRLFRPSCSTPSALVFAPFRKVIRVSFVINKQKMLWGCCFHWDVWFSRFTLRYLSWWF